MKIFWVSLFILLVRKTWKRSLQIERNQPPPSDKSPGLTRYRETKTSTLTPIRIRLHPTSYQLKREIFRNLNISLFN